MKALVMFLLLAVTAGFAPAEKVLICISTGATKYHSHYCQGLKKCTHKVEEVSVAEAVRRGYSACGYCY